MSNFENEKRSDTILKNRNDIIEIKKMLDKLLGLAKIPLAPAKRPIDNILEVLSKIDTAHIHYCRGGSNLDTPSNITREDLDEVHRYFLKQGYVHSNDMNLMNYAFCSSDLVDNIRGVDGWVEPHQYQLAAESHRSEIGCNITSQNRFIVIPFNLRELAKSENGWNVYSTIFVSFIEKTNGYCLVNMLSSKH